MNLLEKIKEIPLEQRSKFVGLFHNLTTVYAEEQDFAKIQRGIYKEREETSKPITEQVK